MNLSERRLSERVLRNELGELFDRRDMEEACGFVMEMSPAKPSTPLGKALSDADALEEIGLLGVLRQVRGAVVNSKSESHLLRVWRRQQEYHYWEARIRTGFYLDFSRELAMERLDRMGHFFDVLEEELTNGKAADTAEAASLTDQDTSTANLSD